MSAAPYLRAEEAARFLTIGLKGFYDEVRKGRIKVIVMRGKWRFDPADLVAYADERAALQARVSG